MNNSQEERINHWLEMLDQRTTIDALPDDQGYRMEFGQAIPLKTTSLSLYQTADGWSDHGEGMAMVMNELASDNVLDNRPQVSSIQLIMLRQSVKALIEDSYDKVAFDQQWHLVTNVTGRNGFVEMAQALGGLIGAALRVYDEQTVND